MWTEELDEQIRAAVWASVPRGCFDDAFQEARLAVVEADDSHTPVWYLQRAIGAARDWCRREGKRPISMDMERLAERVAAGERV